jgi:hypothetical protein
MRRSRDRGCKGHRILRRVLVGGRHLRTSRAIAFHEAVVKATLAASSRGEKHTARARKSSRRALAGRAKALPRLRGRGRGDRGVRGLIVQQAPWEKNAHALVLIPRTRGVKAGGKQAARVLLRSAEAFTGAVKHSVPRSVARSPRLRGMSTR